MPSDRRCGLKPETCVEVHICPVLDDVRPGKDRWSARCPAHVDHKGSLSISLGTKGQPIVWNCFARCDPAYVRRAMIAKGISPLCLPWEPPRDAERERDVLAEVEQIVMDDDANPQRIRLLIGMALWDCGKVEAAAKLGISRATMYRAVSPVRQKPRTARENESLTGETESHA